MMLGVMEQRLGEFARVLGVGQEREPGHPGEDAAEGLEGIARAVEDALGPPDRTHAYLLLAVLDARVPTEEEVVDLVRAWRVDGIHELLGSRLRGARRRSLAGPALPVRVVDGTVIDVTDTAQSAFTTGIQRVARETVGRWTKDRDVLLVCWDASFSSLRTLDAPMRERAGAAPAQSRREIVIPFGATLVLPEIAVEPRRAARLRSIARFAGGRTVAIGFDCIPVTTAEVAGPGMPGAFSKYLSCLAHFDLVVPISHASAAEYLGWRAMLAGAGLAGPRIDPIELPSTGVPPATGTIEATSAQLGLGDGTVVLAIGSHEPRKNHVNFLHAAELSWRAGHDFTVVMVGGNSWNTESFDRIVGQLRRRGRRIVTVSRAEDAMVWDLYRLARFSVFCSLNEGFGLPVVESLASGTPVITSDFGSMRDIGEGHGAVLVDPADVEAMAAAMSRLLEDDGALAELEAATSSLPRSTWDDYAAALWRAASPETVPTAP